MTTPNYSTDQDDITRYALGDMTVDEQIAFEVRMVEDEQLQRAAIAASAIDDLLRRTAEQDGRTRICPNETGTETFILCRSEMRKEEQDRRG